MQLFLWRKIRIHDRICINIQFTCGAEVQLFTEKMPQDSGNEHFRVFACLTVVLLHLNAWCFRTGSLDEPMKIAQACINILKKVLEKTEIQYLCPPLFLISAFIGITTVSYGTGEIIL